MDYRTLNLISQRLKYLIRGNSHGVSANWLAKRTSGLYSGVREYAANPSCSFNISEEAIAAGELLFSSLVAEKSGTNYDKNFDCEVGLASFLYALILHKKPTSIIETGVANGITTNLIMKALEKTGGALHSFDIDSRTKNVYSGPGHWNFHHLSGDLEKSLKDKVSRIGKVDLWLHDSNHGYRWQAFEYNLAVSNLNTAGVLISDDIDSSTAWGLASGSILRESIGVFDARKFFGVATI